MPSPPVDCRKLAALALAAVQLLPVPLQAQQGQAAPPAAPVVRATTRLVQVNVVVRDKNGQPVTDLRREDFLLLEDGKEQKISVFDKNEIRAETAKQRPLPTGSTAAPVLEFSNRAVTLPSGVTHTVLLFDGLNTKVKDQLDARRQILVMLRALRPDDRVAIYVLGSGLRILHNFTSDKDALLRTFENFYGDGAQRYEAATDDIPNEIGIFQEFIAGARQRVDAEVMENRAKFTLQAIEAIARNLEGIPGRKTLVWVSAGFPLGSGLVNPAQTFASLDSLRGFSELSAKAARAVSQANIAVYPVDSRGLFTLPEEPRKANNAPDDSQGAQSGSLPGQSEGGGAGNSIGAASGRAGRGRILNSSRPSDNPQPVLLPESERTTDTMRIIAEFTGGRAFYNSNDLSGSIREAMDDLNFSYTLGFYPAHGKWDGRYHELKVRVARPGVDVRHRTGYTAYTEKELSEAQGRAALAEAMTAPLDQSRIGLTVWPDQPALASGRHKLRLRIDTRDLSLTREPDVSRGNVDMLFSLYDKAGVMLWNDGRRIALNLKPDTYDRLLREGISLRFDAPERAEAAMLRVAVLDAATGHAGSVSVPLAKLRDLGVK